MRSSGMSVCGSSSIRQVAVVGAGPYGLAVAAHLQRAGIDTQVIGQPMQYWHEMPRGMLLRSPWRASTIASPGGTLSLASYEAECGPVRRPIPLEDFVAYGQWYQQRAVPDVDTRTVQQIARDGDGFTLRFREGGAFRASRVVIATGLRSFERRLPELARLPGHAVSHSADLRDPAELCGRRVLVVGAGQSAIESAALLREAGAVVHVVVREPRVRWLVRSGWLHKGPLPRLLYAPTDVGPAGLSWLAAAPALVRRMPARRREAFEQRCVRPAAAAWLKPRMRDVRLLTGRRIVYAAATGATVTVRLDDASELVVDHVLQGTGFALDVRAHPALHPQLADAIAERDGYPILGAGFESSVPGLHFVGAMSAMSFGPVMRFVSGTWTTAPGLTRHIAAAARSAAVARAPAPQPRVISDGRTPGS